MPTYEFKCDGCEAEREVLLPFSKSGSKLKCCCGREMRRVISLTSFIMHRTSKEKVLGILNKEEGSPNFPGGPPYRERYENAMSKSIFHERPLEEKVFTGFSPRGEA